VSSLLETMRAWIRKIQSRPH